MEDDEQWTRATEYISAVSELNYMTQIVIMMYEDPTKVPKLLILLTCISCHDVVFMQF